MKLPLLCLYESYALLGSISKSCCGRVVAMFVNVFYSQLLAVVVILY